MKILHIVTSLAVGGVETMLLQLLSRLDTQGNSHAVIALRDDDVIGGKIRHLGIPVYALGMSAGKPSPASIMRFRQYLKTFGRPDLIQGWDYYGDYAASFSKTLMGWRHTPVIWSIHHTPYELNRERKLTALLIRIGAWASRSADQIVYVSQTSRERHEAYGYPARCARIISNGFDLSEFQPSASVRSAVRLELGLDQDVFLIGSIARFHPMKDHANFISAAGLLASQRQDVHFLLTGKQVDDQNQAIVELIAINGLQHKASLLGERSDISRLMSALDIFTVSSAWGESFPLVIGEAMACAVPCVVTDIGDSAHIVGSTGLTVPPKDAEALCRAWVKIFEMSEQERVNLGLAARQRVLERFSLGNAVSQYENLYTDVVNSK